MTMHYHGTPITPLTALHELVGRCFCVSYAAPDQVRHCHELGQSVMVDNGAFTIWQKVQEGKPIPARLQAASRGDWSGFYAWCEEWLRFQTTWAVIPDVIDGDEVANERLIAEWPFGTRGAPVWHMHESLDRLAHMVHQWPLVCIGSSGEYAKLNTPRWRARMARAMDVACPAGVPLARLHMLRGMAQSRGPYPFFSLDSSDIAQNHSRKLRTPRQMAERWDGMQCPPVWRSVAEQPELEAA